MDERNERESPAERKPTYLLGETVFLRRQLEFNESISFFRELVSAGMTPPIKDATPMTVVEYIRQTCPGGTQFFYRCAYLIPDGHRRLSDFLEEELVGKAEYRLRAKALVIEFSEARQEYFEKKAKAFAGAAKKGE